MVQGLSYYFLYLMGDPGWSEAHQTQSEPGCVVFHLSRSSRKGPETQTSGSSPKASNSTRIIASPESNAYLGQLLSVGQIVHGDGQEHVQ